jgi:cellulose synthase/poly-beta-1,6-N-acetylglucosamine synthase-like glycosyltransferase
MKHNINWRGHILNMNLRKLKTMVNIQRLKGICLDVVVPSYRMNNNDFLERIALLRASRDDVYVKFWFIVDNPAEKHVADVKLLAKELNSKQLRSDGNYFINVVHYAENRGASYARNTGYNYSVADWILFLDDDVVPNTNILDAYIGAIKRYPEAKVLAGMTVLPESENVWTEMLRACNVGYFYGISRMMRHPPWAVTANLLVRGSRHNPTIQFKNCFPKTGGGEDIDFVYQYKEFYPSTGIHATAA